MQTDGRTEWTDGRKDGRTHGRRQNYIPLTSYGDKKNASAAFQNYLCNKSIQCPYLIIGTRDLFNISYSRELYLFSKFLHFEEIVRVKIAFCFEMIVSET